MDKKKHCGFEDIGSEWNQFSQGRGKLLGILFIEEKEYCIFVYGKCGSDVTVCDSFRNNGKQDYLGLLYGFSTKSQLFTTSATKQ